MNRSFAWGLFLLMSGAWDVSAGALTDQELRAARQIYVVKCAKCHRFYDPRQYPEAEWNRWLDSMVRKAKLKPAQIDLLDRYLDSYRAGNLSGRPEEKPRETPRSKA